MVNLPDNLTGTGGLGATGSVEACDRVSLEPGGMSGGVPVMDFSSLVSEVESRKHCDVSGDLGAVDALSSDVVGDGVLCRKGWTGKTKGLARVRTRGVSGGGSRASVLSQTKRFARAEAVRKWGNTDCTFDVIGIADEYLLKCPDRIPSLAGLALAIGKPRRTLEQWLRNPLGEDPDHPLGYWRSICERLDLLREQACLNAHRGQRGSTPDGVPDVKLAERVLASRYGYRDSNVSVGDIRINVVNYGDVDTAANGFLPDGSNVGGEVVSAESVVRKALSASDGDSASSDIVFSYDSPDPGIRSALLPGPSTSTIPTQCNTSTGATQSPLSSGPCFEVRSESACPTDANVTDFTQGRAGEGSFIAANDLSRPDQGSDDEDPYAADNADEWADENADDEPTNGDDDGDDNGDEWTDEVGGCD